MSTSDTNSTPKCFAAECQLPSAHMLVVGEVGTSFWCSEHYPDFLVSAGTDVKARRAAQDTIDRLRGAEVAPMEGYD